MGFLSDVGNGIYDAYRKYTPGGMLLSAATSDPGSDAEKQRKDLLYRQAQLSGQFANQTQRSYGAYGAQGQQALDAFGRRMNGADSLSAEQLRQSLGQNLAAQRSLAAGAAPQDAAAAARTAAIQSGRLGAGLAGQQAMAGIQERSAAAQQYGSLLQGLRGQDLQATLGSRQNAMAGYGANNAGQPEKSAVEKYGPAVIGGLAAISDPRLKKDVTGGDDAANSAASKLGSYLFKYKDPAAGSGEQLGVMADDLERAGLKHTVMDTPSGKMVHGAKLATTNTAMISALARRLTKLEGSR